MKTRKMKMKFHRALCTIMAVIFVMGDIVPAVSAQGTGAASADTKQVIGFESVNPVEYYELEYGGAYEELEIPDKIRVVTELPEDLQLSAFEEGETPEQQDELLPVYEYSHTVNQLQLESQQNTSSSAETASEDAASQNASSEETVLQTESTDTAQAASAENSSAEGTVSENGTVSVSEEELQQLMDESPKISYNSAKVYSFIDNTGKTQYRVYGSVNGQEPCWWAVDEEGTVLGIVEELDANWDFSKLDSTVAGEYQVKVQLPENYILNQGVEIACMQIMVAQENGTQVTLEKEDGSLPDVLPVSYIKALSTQQARVNTETFPLEIIGEGIPPSTTGTFVGGDITRDSVPAREYYLFKETRDGSGNLTGNGARLIIENDGVTVGYSNVTGLYNVQQPNGTYQWYYSVLEPENAVAWVVPDNAYLELTYEPDPAYADRFSTITIKSSNWWDGTINGRSKNYTVKYPRGANVSFTVDLPSLYTNHKQTYTGIDESAVTVTHTQKNLYTDVGYSEHATAWETVTFNFTVPSNDVTIDLTFQSYALNGGKVRDKIIQVGQRYVSPGQYTTYYEGYSMVRVYEASGNATWSYGKTQYGHGTGMAYTNGRTPFPRGYQLYGPATADEVPARGLLGSATSPYHTERWVSAGTTDGSRAQPTMHDNNVSRLTQVNKLYYDTVGNNNTGDYRMDNKIVSNKQDANGNSSLFFVWEYDLQNTEQVYATSDAYGRDLPRGILVHTQNNQSGVFIPFESDIAKSASKEFEYTQHNTIRTIKVEGMTIKITRILYRSAREYSTWDSKNYYSAEYAYTVEVQGATGYIGVDFVTSIDTQNFVSINGVSNNIQSAQIYTTPGGGANQEARRWTNIGSGGAYYFYRFGNNSSDNQFYDGGWNRTYYNREGGVALRVVPEENAGMPYLQFSFNNGTTTRVSGTNSSTAVETNLDNNKPVEARKKTVNGTDTYEFLFGLRNSSGTYFGWGKDTILSINSDPKQIAYEWRSGDTNWTYPGGSVDEWGVSKGVIAYGDDSYIAVPETIPTSSSGMFRGWKIRISGEPNNNPVYLTDPNTGEEIYLQPGQLLNVKDEYYLPWDKFQVVNGATYSHVGGSGYYNAIAVKFDAVFSNSDIQEGDTVSAPIHTYTQTDASVNTNTEEDGGTLGGEYTDQISLRKPAFAPWGQNYRVRYDDTVTVNNQIYLLNQDLSLTEGVTGETTNSSDEYILGYLRYDKAIGVTYAEGDKPQSAAGATMPTDSNQYTTVSGHQNSITLQEPGGTFDEGDFNGWTLAYNGGSVNIPKEITTLVLDGNQSEASTTSGTTMTIGGDAAEAVYTSGTVNLTAVWNTMLPIASARANSGDLNPDLWNNQYKNTEVTQFYSGTGITLEAKFKYDFATRQAILEEWGKRAQGQKASEEMSQYLDWALYGLEGANGTVRTWSLRGDSSGGDGITTDLALGDTAGNDGYATATITINIPSNLVTYEAMSVQQFYLFAWNDASNSQLDTNYDAVAAGQENSPFDAIVTTSNPYWDIGGDAMGRDKAVASEFWSYGAMVARGITSTTNDMAVRTGDEIQWKNIDAQTQSFEVEFKYDTSIPWSVQSAAPSSADTSNQNAIRVILAKKVGSTWSKLNRLGPDGTFGSGGELDDYDIELVDPQGSSDTFKVRVTAKNSVMAASGNNDDTEFLVAAYNFQNGETSAPNAGSYTKMSDILGDLGTNNVMGHDVPAVQSSVKIYPKGVKIVDNGGEVLTKDVNVSKDYWQPSAQQTAVFTFDNAGYPNSYQGNTDFQNRFDPTRDNYHVALYKQSNGSWTLEESDDTAQDDRKYIQSITPDANGQVTVQYSIPAEENTQNTQYRLMAWYGDISGNNEIQTTAITPDDADNVMAHQAELATVNITLNPVNTFTKVEMDGDNRPNGVNVWNDQKRYNDIQIKTGDQDDSQAGDQDLVLTATFKYDVGSKAIIESYWNNRTNTPTTDDGMGRYLNWVMYGYNTQTRQHSTWVIREQNVTGGSNNVQRVDGLSVDLELGNDGIATISVIISADSVTYDLLEHQHLFLFAWNDAAQSYTDNIYKPVQTNYKALSHTYEGSDATIYKSILQRKFNTGNIGHGLGGSSNEWSSVGTLPNYKWNFRVIPRAVTQTNDTTGDATTPTQVLDNSKKASQVLQSVTFKYDNTVPWATQNNSGALGQQVLRVAVYKQNYPNSDPTALQNDGWSLIAHHNGNGGVSTVSGYSIAVTPDEQASTFTVTVTANNENLAANYANYDSRIKIVAYNTQNNYSGNTANLLETGGQLNTLIGSHIPSNTTSVQMNPAPMESVGHGGVGDTTTGTIGHHEFTFSKETGVANTVNFTFQGDTNQFTAPGTDPDNVNTGMAGKFGLDGGNVIFTLWKREGGTGDFQMIGHFTNGNFNAINNAQDQITSVGFGTDNKIEVEVAVDANTNTEGTQFRVYAWYVSSNSQNWNDQNMDNAVFAQEDPGSTVNGVVPYSTATMTVNYQDPDFYINIPSLVTLYDDAGNVKDSSGTDLSDQYAGASTEISYKSEYQNGGTGGTAPEIRVDIADNMPMTMEGAASPSNEHIVGVYFTDGYKNNVQGGNSGMVTLGTLSQTRTQAENGQTQTTPIGETLPFYLNTKQGHNGEKYTVTLDFHFIINSSTGP